MEQITLTKEECVEQCINKDLKLLDYRVQQILEGVLSESTTYGDARNKLETLKIIAESHFKTEHASVIYKLASKKLDKKINATPIKE
ncbi:transcriptional regulator [Staphylococcus aureus]